MIEPWWKRATVYQIYPKSFKDTTGNGLGDLQGIIQKLDYLKELGIDMIWLTPIYASPQNDNGYDISNYEEIFSDYGTMADFEQLLEETHGRGMKLMMDIVINHTSTAHDWFRQSRSSVDNPYRSYYIWKDTPEDELPNNWQSKFGGSAWAYDSETKAHYLHLFDVSQADLNWENSVMRAEVYEMMRRWLDKGVDGFRLDVINLISKNQTFPSDDKGDGRRFYTDGPRIHEYLHEMNQAVFKPYNAITVGEMSSTNVEDCVQYTHPSSEELDMVFNFHHLKVDYKDGEKWTNYPFDLVELKRILSHWQTHMHEGGGWNALFWCNHDQPRVVSRYGDDGEYRDTAAKMLATTIHLLKGTPYVYQGEEFGMTNPGFTSITQYRDVETKNAYNSLKEKGVSEEDIMAILAQKSRDNARTPMQWNEDANAGFTEGEPWIPMAKNADSIHAKAALEKPTSVFYHYQKLIKLRKTDDLITEGRFHLVDAAHPDVFAYVREHGQRRWLIVSNFRAKPLTFQTSFTDVDARIVVSTHEDSATAIESIALRPYESIVYELS
ncbi:alpha,alpha-phosphotrehalase [Aureibacillus halotolerans]|uniref:Alpha,alpha-phosphotrehalase n=1 Tax=Aureibacillus halotolerans TaxID=1508390 RepID=A0A4R6TVK4_9BACI|nr:alpha,alpha-phosphotrehalase [Aureibacillus halotolerans]TDQ37451.1 trehalose-6-phosphate hydrolase [Aureibacillus halotolerans]